MASVTEKLNFPLKFEKDAFVLDFNSGKSTTSDEKPSSYKRYTTSSKSLSLASFRGPRGRQKQKQSLSTGLASTYKFNLDSEEFKITRQSDGNLESNSNTTEDRLSKFYLYSPAATDCGSFPAGDEFYNSKPLARICEDQEQSEET